MSEKFGLLRTLASAWVWGFKENIRFAGTALVSHKLRSGLTTLGIIIGVMTVIAMVSVIEGFNNNIISEFESFGSTLVQFQKFDVQFGPGGNRDEEQFRRRELTVEDAAALKRLVPAMAAVSPERYWFAGGFGQEAGAPNVIFDGKEAIPDLIVGVNEDYPRANNQYVGDGRFISATDVTRNGAVTVVGHAIADALFPFTDPVGKVVTISGRRYEIVGVMQQQGNSFFESTDSHVYLPISTFDSHFPWVKRRTGVNIATVPHRPEWVDRITEEGTAVLRARRKVPFNKPNDFGIRTNDQFIQNFRQITGGITLAMIFVSSIALLVGGVGVMNIMLVSVTERTREIGVRKALGAMKRDIVIQFLTEAMTLSALGGLLGILVGFGVSALVGKVSPLPTEVPFWSVLVGLLVSLSVGLFFGIYPAYKAAKLDPIEALRYE